MTQVIDVSVGVRSTLVALAAARAAPASVLVRVDLQVRPSHAHVESILAKQKVDTIKSMFILLNIFYLAFLLFCG